MEKVYVVRHIHDFKSEDKKPKKTWLGTYPSEQLAQAAIESLRTQPDFLDAPDGFEIMQKVYVVEHTHDFKNEREESETKWLGVYSTEQLAEDAIGRYRKRPGFCDALDGFNISPWVLNVNHWDGGYFTIYYDDVESKPEGEGE